MNSLRQWRRERARVASEPRRNHATLSSAGELCVFKFGEVEGALEVSRELRRFRGHLQRAQSKAAKQVTLDRLRT
jgi:hypothetical protein